MDFKPDHLSGGGGGGGMGGGGCSVAVPAPLLNRGRGEVTHRTSVQS